MTANVDGMVNEAVRAYRAGSKEEARALLLRAVEINERHEQAWLWLSAVVESLDEQRTCLENVLVINPGNTRAQQGLEVLNRRSGAAPAPSGQEDDAFANATFTGPVKAQPAAPPQEELPSSIEWANVGLETSSPSASARPVPEPSAEEYDNWVANMNLGGKGGASPFFGETAESSMFGFDDDAFDEPKSAAPAASRSVQGFDLGGDGPFGTDFVDFDDDFESPAPSPVRAAAPPASRASKAPVLSPRPVVQQDDEDFGDIDDPQGFDRIPADMNYDDAQIDYSDPEEMFHYIPPDIKATRLPGTRERAPIVSVLGLVLLLLLNLGAVGLLIVQLAN